MQQPNPGVSKEEVVVDVAKTKFSDLWRKEDYWAIWLGTFILLAGLIIFLTNPQSGMQVSQKNFLDKIVFGRHASDRLHIRHRAGNIQKNSTNLLRDLERLGYSS